MEPQQLSNSNGDIRETREQQFTRSVIQRCQSDKGLAARLRRADNPAMEYQSWELLVAYGVDLDQESQRLPYVTIVAAMAKTKCERNGSLRLGRAIAECYEEGRESQQAKVRLRRLLACSDLVEVCRILRPLFSLIDSKTTRPLDYARLLRQLRLFVFDPQQVKAEWAQEFYNQQPKSDEPEVAL
jgi:CRISPR system Cascade subunit CasB